LKRVAIIAPDFAPSSLPPALRVRFFATHLPEFGWEPIVITVDPKYYEQTIDHANIDVLPGNLQVIRTKALPQRFTRRFGFGDLGMRALWHHWNALSQQHKTKKIDALLIPVPAFLPMILGRLAYMRFRIPYVIDYIDPWRTDYFSRLPKHQRPRKWWLADGLAAIVEPLAIRRASHLIAVSRGTNNMVIANYPYFSPENTTEIPYGGEEGDAEYVRQHPRHNPIFDPNDGLIHLCSTGHFNPDLSPAANALFAALQIGLERDPKIFGRVRVHFVGTTYAADAAEAYQVLPLVREKGIESFITEHPERVSYFESLQIMSDAHGLLMLGNPSPHYTASKVFPYILSRRPILALFHEQSSVVSILEETQAGRLVTFSSDRPIASQINTIYEELKTLISLPVGSEPATNWAAFEHYTTRSMAQKLAFVLDKVVKTHG